LISNLPATIRLPPICEIFLQGKNIPYLSPPNFPFSSDMVEALQGHACFGNFFRERNDRKIDASAVALNDNDKIVSKLSVEVKDRKHSISLSEMEGILQRIPEDSIIHLVFINKLQPEEYYGKCQAKKSTKQKRIREITSFDEFLEKNPRLLNRFIYRLVTTRNNEVQFEPIKGLVNACQRNLCTSHEDGCPLSCVVLFVEVDYIRKKKKI